MTESIDQHDHYLGDRAKNYSAHHDKNLRTRLTTRQEQAVLRKAIEKSGRPKSAMDIPCGTGRFLSVFRDCGVAELTAADASTGMLEVAKHARPDDAVSVLHTSAFDIEMPNNSIDFIACLRFFHHLSMKEDRMQALNELKRVSRKHVAISLWTNGNLASFRRRNKPPPPAVSGYGKRICRRSDEIEPEFLDAGFKIVDHYDVWPMISMWRLYLLQIEET